LFQSGQSDGCPDQGRQLIKTNDTGAGTSSSGGVGSASDNNFDHYQNQNGAYGIVPKPRVTMLSVAGSVIRL